MTSRLAELTRQQQNGLTGWMRGLGALKSLTFQRVADSGADEYLSEFANGSLRVDMGLDDEDRIDKVNFQPR
jgi:hypothetical protein